MASLEICLCRQVFVSVETSRSHLVRSAVVRNLTFFGYQNKLVPILSQVGPGPVERIFGMCSC